MTYNLTLLDRTILHLDIHARRIDHEREVYPQELTQNGTAAAIGRTRAHAAIIFRDLREKDLITTGKERVDGLVAHTTVAKLTDAGRTAAARIRRIIEADGGSVYDAVLAPQSSRTDLAQLVERMKRIQLELDEVKALVRPLLADVDAIEGTTPASEGVLQ